MNPDGYLDIDGKALQEGAEYMVKSRIIGREINITMQDGSTKTRIVYEKQVVFWSKKYANKAKADREKVISKAKDMVDNPSKYDKSTSYGAAKYVENIAYDKKTKQVIAATKKELKFDESKVLEEEKYDGYYSIVTSEMKMSTQKIIDIYRGMWEIEETFRITKGSLEARPVYVSRKDRINAHFLSCFIALVIIRLLQKLTGKVYSSDRIIDCLNKISCSKEEDNLYLFDYRSDISDAIGEALDIDFTKKRLRLGEIKSIIADAKKSIKEEDSIIQNQQDEVVVERFVEVLEADDVGNDRIKSRGGRRKALKDIIIQLEEIRSAENAYKEKIPENLQSGEAYESAEETVELIEQAIELLNESF